MKIYTIRDVAEMAGVSVTTVSRVLNNRPDVSRITQEKVRRVIEECHFVGNVNARSLKQAENDVVALIIRGRRNPFLNELTEAVLQYGRSTGSTLITEYIDEQADEFQHALTLISTRRLRGIVFIGSRIDERSKVLDGITLPMVFTTVSTEGTSMERAASVSIDDRRMAYEAMKALIEYGHRHIAIFGGNRNGADSLALRAKGAAEAQAEHGWTLGDDYYVETRFTLSDAYESAREYFSKRTDIDAVFCMSDVVAMGVIRALKDLGMDVPRDISVMGIDGIDVAEYSLPRLSTIAQPVQELARRSVEVLFDMMERDIPATHVTVSAKLLMRESVIRR